MHKIVSELADIFDKYLIKVSKVDTRLPFPALM